MNIARAASARLHAKNAGKGGGGGSYLRDTTVIPGFKPLPVAGLVTS